MTSTPAPDTEGIPGTMPADRTVHNLSCQAISPKLGHADHKKSIDIDYELREFFRPMDPNIMILFEEDLILTYPLTEDTVGTALGLLEFK